MKPPTQAALRLAGRRLGPTSPANHQISLSLAARHIHTTLATPATVAPIHGTGPPPEPPRPAVDSSSIRLERRKKHAELLERAQEIRGGATKHTYDKTTNEISEEGEEGDGATGREKETTATTTTTTTTATATTTTTSASPLARRRFWKHVHVQEVEGSQLEVHLDTRPLRRPTPQKDILRIPASKPLLAAALALEWDLLVSAQQATRHHLIPLTSLVCRALDILDADGLEKSDLRSGIARTLMRYLDTDSLLCWAPPPRYGQDAPDAQGNSLRDVQRRASEEVLAFLCTRVWPGVEIEPVLDGESIMPRGQKLETRQIIEGWIMGLSAWELAGLERAVLAGKGLLGAVRLLVEWSEGHVGLPREEGESDVGRFGVEEAAKLASIEVDWQTGNWGEVEDTHDVEKEDLRRQLGSVILLVSGMGKL
ncbi:hypothetical protein GGR50DRAFT_643081 [Xylaria sp. CBS 124048]|nr:hypothetical protein GGR50DRAFT_643081 [Xylaria sp. CBS 124048]